MTTLDIARVNNLFEPLLFWNNNYEIEPALAESVESSADGTKWTVKMRQGVTFHNGKDVTAEDAWFSIQRVADPKAPLSGGGQLSQILDFESTKVVDATTLELVLKVPYAILDGLLAEYTVGIIPTDFDIANPVGTGAFAYKSFDPGKTSTFTKYADYWGDPAFVDELQIQDFPDPSAMVNALQAGQIQTVDSLPYNLIDTIKGAGGGVLVSETGAWVPFTMRVDQAPFNDVKVRQAMRLIVDRQQMIDQTLSGYGSLGNDMYAPFDVAYASDLPQREQDIDQAKSLLAKRARRVSRSSCSPATTSARSRRPRPTCSSSRPSWPASTSRSPRRRRSTTTSTSSTPSPRTSGTPATTSRRLSSARSRRSRAAPTTRPTGTTRSTVTW